MIVYHGTKNEKKFNYEKGYQASRKKGRAEFGSGLYTINSFFEASCYGNVIALEIALEKKHSASSVFLDINDIKYFLAKISNVQLKKFKEKFDLEKYQKRSYYQEGKIRADDFLTYMLINNEGKSHLFSQEINDFFVENKVKYLVDRFAGNSLVVIYDFDIIKRKVDIKDVKDEDLVLKYVDEKPKQKTKLGLSK